MVEFTYSPLMLSLSEVHLPNDGMNWIQGFLLALVHVILQLHALTWAPKEVQKLSNDVCYPSISKVPIRINILSMKQNQSND